MLIKDLIVLGKSPWQDVFDPSREITSTNTNKFNIQWSSITEQQADCKISSLQDIKIAPGEGKIVEVNGQRLGAYMDEMGETHIVDTTCTHKGCKLSWNSAERSWDCPCHGSRFSYKGNVIEGPAVKDLNCLK